MPITIRLPGDASVHVDVLRSSGELELLKPSDGLLSIPWGASLRLAIRTPASLALFVPVARQVVEVRLGRTSVTDADLAPLQHFAEVRCLDFSGVQGIGDADLSPLNALRGLEHLSLEGTRIDDAAIARLMLPALLDLVLEGTRVTPAGVRAFVARHPGCRLVGDFEGNASRAHEERLLRRHMVRLIHRVAGRHPLPYTAGEAEIAEELRSLFPRGTRFDAVPADGRERARPGVTPDWDDELLRAMPLHRLLSDLGPGGTLLITLPGGACFPVPWNAYGGPDRRTAATRNDS